MSTPTTIIIVLILKMSKPPVGVELLFGKHARVEAWFRLMSDNHY